MTKADLVENVYLKTGFSKKESAEIVEMVFDIMKTTLEVSGISLLKTKLRAVVVIPRLAMRLKFPLVGF
jgi:hypothetical protein